MSNIFSRRDFMKGAGVSVLAVASAGLFAGCGGTGDMSGEGNKKGTTVTIPGTEGVEVTLKGYKKGWALGGSLGSLEGIGNTITENYANKTWITVRFEVKNGTSSPIPMANTAAGMLGSVISAVLLNDYSKIDQVYKMGFKASATDADVHFAVIGGTFTEDGVFDPISGSLAAGATGYIQLYCILTDSNWGTMTINYQPDGATASTKFTLTQNDVITG